MNGSSGALDSHGLLTAMGRPRPYRPVRPFLTHCGPSRRSALGNCVNVMTGTRPGPGGASSPQRTPEATMKALPLLGAQTGREHSGDCDSTTLQEGKSAPECQYRRSTRSKAEANHADEK